MTAVAVCVLVPCPGCAGVGEIHVSGDPRGPNCVTRGCPGCRGEATVTAERAAEIRVELDAEWDGP